MATVFVESLKLSSEGRKLVSHRVLFLVGLFNSVQERGVMHMGIEPHALHTTWNNSS